MAQRGNGSDVSLDRHVDRDDHTRGRDRRTDDRVSKEEIYRSSRRDVFRLEQDKRGRERVNLREHSAPPAPAFLQEDYRRSVAAGPVVLRKRDAEVFEFTPRRRSPSPKPKRRLEQEEIIIRRDDPEPRPQPPPPRRPEPVRELEEIIIRRDEKEKDDVVHATPPPRREEREREREREEIIIRRDERRTGGDDDFLYAPLSRWDDRDREREEIIIRRDERDTNNRSSRTPLPRPVSHERERSRAPRSSESDQESIIRRIIVRNHSRSNSAESAASRESPSSNTAHVIWNPSSRRDMTIHLELDIEEDVESKIEDLAHLKRMGRFRDADEYFEANLSNRLQELPVALEYADLLLAQGYFSRIFESFDDDEIAQSYINISADEPNIGEKINLALVLQLARSYSEPNLHLARGIAGSASTFLRARLTKDQVNFNQTELQILCRYLTLISYIYTNSSLVTIADFEIGDSWQRWAELYQHLQEENRHWELRDLVIASVAAFGPLLTCRRLFGEASLAAGVAKLLNDWTRRPADETQDLYLLDIIVCFCRELIRMLENNSDLAEQRNFLFEQVRAVAAAIKQNNPQSIQYRPYLEWILTEQYYTRILQSQQGYTRKVNTTGITSHFFSGFPGRTLWSGVLPIYVPVASETPGWPTPSLPDLTTLREPNELLTAVLEASQEHCDFSTQVACLQELICQSYNRQGLFKRLDHLQLSIAGDKLGALRTRLSKYLVVINDETCQLLKKELIELDPRNYLWRSFSHPTLEWCQRRILYALTLSIDGDSEEARTIDSLANTLRLSLPQNLLLQLDRARKYEFEPLGTASTRTLRPSHHVPQVTEKPQNSPKVEIKKVGTDQDKREESGSYYVEVLPYFDQPKTHIISPSSPGDPGATAGKGARSKIKELEARVAQLETERAKWDQDQKHKYVEISQEKEKDKAEMVAQASAETEKGEMEGWYRDEK